MSSKNMMTRDLSDIDRVYGRLNRYASNSEKLKYCSRLIEKTRSVMGDGKNLTEHIILNSKAIIEAAQVEIQVLSSGN